MSRKYWTALALMVLGLIAIVASGCGGGGSKGVETAAQPPPRQVGVVGAVTPAAAGVAGLDPKSRLEALVRGEFAGLTNVGVTRFHSADVREERDGSYRVVAEFVSDDVPRTGDEREENLARKRLMEERMQHAFLTIYTSGIDVSNAIVSARFKTSVIPRGTRRVEGDLEIYRTWMTREKAAGVNWADPSLDLRTVWEVLLLHAPYR